MVEEHLLGERRTFAQAEQLKHLVFLAGEMDALALNLDRLGIQVHDDIAGTDDRFGMALGAANNGRDAGDQFVLVKGLCEIVVGAVTEGFDLRLDVRISREDHDRCVDPRHAQLLQDFIAGNIRQREIEDDDVILVDLAEVDAFFPKICRVNIEARSLQHQFDTAGHRIIIFDQKNPHVLVSESLWRPT